jgi:hypothetical protein
MKIVVTTVLLCTADMSSTATIDGSAVYHANCMRGQPDLCIYGEISALYLRRYREIYSSSISLYSFNPVFSKHEPPHMPRYLFYRPIQNQQFAVLKYRSFSRCKCAASVLFMRLKYCLSSLVISNYIGINLLSALSLKMNADFFQSSFKILI